jgi:NADH:ubiquinone oxidoreductase subunit 3 (subunit A)
MLYNYAALAFFIAFGLLIPASYLLLARLLRNEEQGNPVKNAPYESAEASLGTERGITHEYLSYFMLSLPFEMVLVMLFFWSSAYRAMPISVSTDMMALVAIAAAFALFGYKLASGGNGR